MESSTCVRLKVRWSGVTATDLCPFPKLAPHGDILRFIYEKYGEMTKKGERGGKTERQKDGFAKTKKKCR